MITHEDDWINAFSELLKQVEDIPIASEPFVVFVSYVRALYRQYIADEKYNGR